ncbi:MAG: class I SAM-dependent methyltransferase [Pseudomonadota bacterium]
MDIDTIERTYRRYARGYDRYFGAVLEPGRRAVVERMRCRPGERILEVGVGTGLSLPLYPPGAEVVGIDVSPEMLERARLRVARERLAQVTGLARMDGERMAFADDSFDKVVALYVVSVVPDPVRLVDEMRRVCRPGGELFIVNHFLHGNPVLAFLERAAAPLSDLLGFHPNVCLKRLIARTRLKVEERAQVNALGLWTLLHARCDKAAAPSPPPR